MSPKLDTKLIWPVVIVAIMAALGIAVLISCGPQIGNAFSTINNSLPVSATNFPAPPATEGATGLEAIDAILNQSLSASLAYNAPASMQLDEILVIELLMNPSLTQEELGREIEESGQVVTGVVEITPLMKAELKAQNEAFDILPLHDSPEQPISAAESTRWQWQVTAKREGSQRLTLVVYMLVKYEGQDYWREVETYRNDILVNVTLGQRLRAFDWKWLIGLLVASGAASFVWTWIKKRLPRKPSPPPN